MADITQILQAAEQFDPKTAERILPLVYDELRRIAAVKMAGQPAGQTLQATALVHEAYLRLLGQGQHSWANRRHFFFAFVYCEQGDLERAAAMLDELEPRWRATMPENHVVFAILASHRSSLAMGSGDGRAAFEEAEKAVAIARVSEQAAALPQLLIERAKVELFLGDLDRARVDVEEAITARKAFDAPGWPSAALARGYLVLGRIYSKQDKPAEAREAFAMALQNSEATLGPDHPATMEARVGAQSH